MELAKSSNQRSKMLYRSPRQHAALCVAIGLTDCSLDFPATGDRLELDFESYTKRIEGLALLLGRAVSGGASSSFSTPENYKFWCRSPGCSFMLHSQQIVVEHTTFQQIINTRQHTCSEKDHQRYCLCTEKSLLYFLRNEQRWVRHMRALHQSLSPNEFDDQVLGEFITHIDDTYGIDLSSRVRRAAARSVLRKFVLLSSSSPDTESIGTVTNQNDETVRSNTVSPTSVLLEQIKSPLARQSRDALIAVTDNTANPKQHEPVPTRNKPVPYLRDAGGVDLNDPPTRPGMSTRLSIKRGKRKSSQDSTDSISSVNDTTSDIVSSPVVPSRLFRRLSSKNSVNTLLEVKVRIMLAGKLSKIVGTAVLPSNYHHISNNRDTSCTKLNRRKSATPPKRIRAVVTGSIPHRVKRLRSRPKNDVLTASSRHGTPSEVATASIDDHVRLRRQPLRSERPSPLFTVAPHQIDHATTDGDDSTEEDHGIALRTRRRLRSPDPSSRVHKGQQTTALVNNEKALATVAIPRPHPVSGVLPSVVDLIEDYNMYNGKYYLRVNFGPTLSTALTAIDKTIAELLESNEDVTQWLDSVNSDKEADRERTLHQRFLRACCDNEQLEWAREKELDEQRQSVEAYHGRGGANKDEKAKMEALAGRPLVFRGGTSKGDLKVINNTECADNRQVGTGKHGAGRLLMPNFRRIDVVTELESVETARTVEIDKSTIRRSSRTHDTGKKMIDSYIALNELKYSLLFVESFYDTQVYVPTADSKVLE